MKKEALIFGLGLVVGVTAIAVLTYNQKKNERTQPIKQDEVKDDNSVSVPVNVSTDNDSSFEAEKAATVESVSERHQEAAQIIKDAVTVICKDNDGHEATDAELDQISSELDDLLSEA